MRYFYNFLIFLFSDVIQTSFSQSNLLDVPVYSPTKNCSFPININTETVRTVATAVPLTFSASLVEKAVVENNGKSVSVHIDQPRTSDTISEGTLFPNLYIYDSCRFYWANNLSGPAATTFDGKGQPLHVLLFYYNKKYDNFTEALKECDDGIAIFSLQITVGDIPNPLFALFQPYLEQVKTAHTEVPALLIRTFLWYVIFLSEYYYTYPGSYFDENTNEEYFCATIIEHPQYGIPFISKEQFQMTFGSLMDSDGNHLTNTVPVTGDCSDQVVKAFGVVAVPFVF